MTFQKKNSSCCWTLPFIQKYYWNIFLWKTDMQEENEELAKNKIKTSSKVYLHIWLKKIVDQIYLIWWDKHTTKIQISRSKNDCQTNKLMLIFLSSWLANWKWRCVSFYSLPLLNKKGIVAHFQIFFPS